MPLLVEMQSFSGFARRVVQSFHRVGQPRQAGSSLSGQTLNINVTLVNWRKIFVYAAALFAAQVLIGFMEGFFFSPESASEVIILLLGSAMVSLVVCGGIFVRLATHQPVRRWSHAMLALLVQIAFARVLALAASAWLPPSEPATLWLEAVVLLFALLLGTSLGQRMSVVSGREVDARPIA